VALIFVAKNGENSIATAPGANGKLSVADVKKAKKTFTGPEILILQLESPLETIQAAAELAARAGVRIILNPAPARPLPEKLLKLVSVLTPNETEAELLTGIAVRRLSDAKKAADKLLSKGVGTVIITLGARGAWIAAPDCRQLVSAPRVKAVDTTAAGDIFNGALAVALAEGRPLVAAVHFASTAAAISVTRMGAQPSVPRRREIEQLMKSCHLPGFE
jgi:ribokinase